MDNDLLKADEKKVRKNIALSMLSKMLVGTCVILTTGFISFCLLFVIMLII